MRLIRLVPWEGSGESAGRRFGCDEEGALRPSWY